MNFSLLVFVASQVGAVLKRKLTTQQLFVNVDPCHCGMPLGRDMGKSEMLGGECRHAEEACITSAFSVICFSFRLPSRALCSTSFPWMTRLNQPRGNAVFCRSLSQFLMGHINIATVLGHLSDAIT